MKPETNRWMSKAESDLDTARFNQRGGREDGATFFAQQAAEKALKAVLIERQDRFPRIHDLLVLAAELDAPKHVLSACRTVNPVYLERRYPDAIETPTGIEVQRIVEAAAEVVEWARNELS